MSICYVYSLGKSIEMRRRRAGRGAERPGCGLSDIMLNVNIYMRGAVTCCRLVACAMCDDVVVVPVAA